MPHVEPLRDTVEGKSDERPVDGSRLSGMVQGEFQQFIPYTTTLLKWIYE